MVKWFKSALILPVIVFLSLTQAHGYSGKTDGINPRLATILHHIEGHFGRQVVITSGCRSRDHNRQIGGARESFHLRCMAADIRLEGINKGRVARYAANLSGRGGVGTYCHDGSVHVDLGPRREWYWGCGGQRSFNQGNFHRSTFHVRHLRLRHHGQQRLHRHRRNSKHHRRH
jgi:Peptidase M15